jgi:hypothetical protein
MVLDLAAPLFSMLPILQQMFELKDPFSFLYVEETRVGMSSLISFFLSLFVLFLLLLISVGYYFIFVLLIVCSGHSNLLLLLVATNLLCSSVVEYEQDIG